MHDYWRVRNRFDQLIRRNCRYSISGVRCGGLLRGVLARTSGSVRQPVDVDAIWRPVDSDGSVHGVADLSSGSGHRGVLPILSFVGWYKFDFANTVRRFHLNQPQIAGFETNLSFFTNSILVADNFRRKYRESGRCSSPARLILSSWILADGGNTSIE